jgi:hypothetical protein
MDPVPDLEQDRRRNRFLRRTKNVVKALSKGEITIANKEFNTNDASVVQLQTTIGGLVSTINQIVVTDFQWWFPNPDHEIGRGDPGSPDVIERYGENCDLETGRNFRSL